MRTYKYRAALVGLVDAIIATPASGWPGVKPALDAARAALRDGGSECGCAEALRAQARHARDRVATASSAEAGEGLRLFAALLDGIADGLPKS